MAGMASAALMPVNSPELTSISSSVWAVNASGGASVPAA